MDIFFELCNKSSCLDNTSAMQHEYQRSNNAQYYLYRSNRDIVVLPPVSPYAKLHCLMSHEYHHCNVWMADAPI